MAVLVAKCTAPRADIFEKYHSVCHRKKALKAKSIDTGFSKHKLVRNRFSGSDRIGSTGLRLSELTWGRVPARGERAHSCDAVDLWATLGSDGAVAARLGLVSGGTSALVPASVLFLGLGGCSQT